MAGPAALDRLLQRDRWVVWAGLVGITGLAWGWMIREAHALPVVATEVNDPVCGCFGLDLGGASFRPWRVLDWLLLTAMWAEMMVAMMVPTVAPMVLTFALVNRRRAEQRRPFAPTAVFLAGYLVVWTAFSAGIAAVQWALHARALLSPAMAASSGKLAGGLLIAAGIFQWLPWKHACLARCRSPFEFFATEWAEGPGGAFAMGLRHGLACTGCCWLLMALLFVLGVMNLVWIAAITGFVLVEKLAPRPAIVSRVAGILLVGWGIRLLVGRHV